MAQAAIPETGGMHVLFCVLGQLEASEIISVGNKNYRIKSASGSRRLDRERALLRCPAASVPALLDEVELLAGQIDMLGAWHAAAGAALDAELLAARLLGVPPTKVAAAALQLAHFRQCGFFSLSAGRFKPVSEDLCRAVAAAHDRERESTRCAAEHRIQLSAGKMPEAVARQALSSLRGKHDRRSPAYRALEEHCAGAGIGIGELCVRRGIVASAEEAHLVALLDGHPHEVADEPVAGPQLAKLELHSNEAFSIDAGGTTEIDDAFSVRRLADGTMRIGVHIAAPAMSLSAAARAQACARMTSVYLPGRKLTMLPVPALRTYSLCAGKVLPCVSLLIDVEPDGERVSGSRMAAGKVRVAGNLDLADFSGWQPGGNALGRSAELEMLAKFAQSAAPDLAAGKDERAFMVSLRDGAPCIFPRSRTAGIDRVVAAMMIIYNCAAAQRILAAGAPLVLRKHGRSFAVEHARKKDGMPYAWASSPLRRYVDLCNQEQLLSALDGSVCAHTLGRLRKMAREYERCHQKARTAQRHMERFWAVVWLGSRIGRKLSAQIDSRGQFALLDDAPLSVPVEAAADAAPGRAVLVRVASADQYTLEVRGELV